MNEKSVDYYNEQTENFIRDYLKGNKRVETAIKYAIDSISNNCQHILDIGCGIGWTSHEISRHFPDAYVKAIDLSSESIKVAKEIFFTENIKFAVDDITRKDFKSKYLFDAILMIDVFEHIPSKKRKIFYKNIKNMLNNNGKIILTCPTVRHQNWLKANNPDGLQPVDEDIDINILNKFAQVISAKIFDFKEVSIWNKNDYFHSIISRDNHKKHSNKIPHLESYNSRKNRIKETKFKYVSSKIKKEKIIAKIKYYIKKVIPK